MITPITDLNEINKYIRQTLIAQSELDGSHILNALSAGGQDLIKDIGDSIYISYERKDCVILFELMDNNSSTNLTMSEIDNSISSFSSYKVHITIYGNASMMMAQVLKARLESEKVRNDLYVKGIYLENVTNAISLNDFINETLWHRTDFDIEISCLLKVEPISNFDNFEEVQLKEPIEKE